MRYILSSFFDTGQQSILQCCCKQPDYQRARNEIMNNYFTPGQAAKMEVAFNCCSTYRVVFTIINGTRGQRIVSSMEKSIHSSQR